MQQAEAFSQTAVFLCCATFIFIQYEELFIRQQIREIPVTVYSALQSPEILEKKIHCDRSGEQNECPA